MSSFSSVIRKPGAKVAPKVAPRRNITRKPASTLADPPIQEDSVTSDSVSLKDAVEPVPEAPRASIAVSTSSQVSTSASNGRLSTPIDVRSVSERESEVSVDVSRERQQVPADDQDSLARSARPVRSLSTQQPPTPIDAESSAGHEPEHAQVEHQPHNSPAPPSPARRKQPPRVDAHVILAQSEIVTPPPTQPTSSPTRDRLPSVASQRASSLASGRSEAEEAFDRINTQLEKIGHIANAILRRTPAAESEDDNAPENERPRKRRRKNNAHSDSIEEQAAQIVAKATGNAELAPKLNKRATPEDAEAHEIEEATTTLMDLCDDKHKWGKTSEIEKQMQANWPEILARRREDAADRLTKSLEGRRKKDKLSIPDQPPGEGEMGAVPEIVIENGQIIVASRDVDRHANTTTAANAVAEADIREDTDIYKRVNSSTIGPRRSQVPPGQRWDDLSTDLFYQGIRMFGTDFKMISNMVPGKNRRQVKLKFNVEERTNWPRLHRCLSQKEDVNLEGYSTMTGLSFGNVSDVYKQMEEDEKKLREEDEARRREEGIISQNNAETNGEADVPMPSIEDSDGEQASTIDGQPVPGDRHSTAAASRLGSTTTGRHTAQPPGSTAKKKQNTRKSQSTSKRGRQAAGKNKGFEGVEERLGDVAEIGIPGG